MPTIAEIRSRYSDNHAIQCVCSSFAHPETNIVMRTRNANKVLEALMWNRGIHMILAGNVKGSPVNPNVWKEVIQMAIDIDVFDRDNVMVVENATQTPNGIIVQFKHQVGGSALFRKNVLKIKRMFAKYDGWGVTVLEPLA